MNLLIHSFISLFVEMAPFLLLGFLFAGILHVWVPRSLYIPKIANPNFKSVIWSALFGIPLPICSCGVIPTAVALRREGASQGAAVSFLISTPATGVDSLLATYSIMGFPFAILRPIAALVTALVGGAFTNWITQSKNINKKIDHEEEKNCCHEKSCCHEKATTSDSESSKNILKRFQKMLHYGFIELVEEISRWLILGLFFGAIISAFVPNDFFLGLRQYPFLASLLVLVLAIPMYTCATGSIPLAMALVAKGMTPGAALVLLMAGPATSMASMFVIGKSFGKRTLIAYLLAIALGALFFGWIMDTFFMDFFLNSILLQTDLFSEEHQTSLFDYICSIVLALLMIRSFLPKKREKQEKESCCCHCEKNNKN